MGNEAVYLSGGVHVEGGRVALLNSTVARNTTVADGAFLGPVSAGIGNLPPLGSDTVGVVTLLNSLVAENVFAQPPPSGSGGPDCGGPITSHSHNLIGDPTACGITLHARDRTGDLGFGAWTDDGTPGHGHLPLVPGSQAIDAGHDFFCPWRDQLDQRRVNIPGVGVSSCDIGAIEFQRSDTPQHNAAQVTP